MTMEQQLKKVYGVGILCDGNLKQYHVSEQRGFMVSNDHFLMDFEGKNILLKEEKEKAKAKTLCLISFTFVCFLLSKNINMILEWWMLTWLEYEK